MVCFSHIREAQRLAAQSQCFVSHPCSGDQALSAFLPFLPPQHTGFPPHVHHLLILKCRLGFTARQEGDGRKSRWFQHYRSKKALLGTPCIQTSIYVSLAGTGSCGRHQVWESILAGHHATLNKARVPMIRGDNWLLRRQPAVSATPFFTAQLKL